MRESKNCLPEVGDGCELRIEVKRYRNRDPYVCEKGSPVLVIARKQKVVTVSGVFLNGKKSFQSQFTVRQSSLTVVYKQGGLEL